MRGFHPFDQIRLRHLFLYWLGGSLLIAFLSSEFGGFWEQFPIYVADISINIVDVLFALICFLLLGWIGGLSWRSFLGRFPNAVDLGSMAKLAIFLVLIAYVDIYLVFVAISFPFPSFVEWLMVSNDNLLYLDEQGSPVLLANIFVPIHLIILVPIMEEIFFRGFVLHRLGRKLGLTPAILISSILFGILHASIFSAFFFGVAMSLVYIHTGSLFLTILCHALNNLIAWALALVHALTQGDANGLEYTISDYRSEWYLGAIAAVAAAWMAVRFIRKPLPKVFWELPDVASN
jgi:membrane protease YdiL (CAAX protease family)